MDDLLIRGGRVIDGTGSPWYRADIAVRDGRISALGALAGRAARRTIDAGELVVSPGFIDMHTHSDLQLLANPAHECKVWQGVTTDVIGHDGLGLAPIDERVAAILYEQLAGWNGQPRIEWSWRSIASYLDHFDQRAAVNVAMHIPHGTIRLLVMGEDDRAPSDQELRRMQQLVDQGMREGAVGLSTGLTYAPCMYASDDEVVELCRPLAPYGGIYSPHHRNYGMRALEAYADSIEIGRRAGVPVHLTHCHFGFPANKGRAPELLAKIDQARAEGVEVTMDSYPYLAGNTYLHALLPTWASAGGSPALLDRLRDPGTRERLRYELEISGSDGFHNVPLGWEMVVIAGITAASADQQVVGLSIPQAAARAGKTPFDFYADLLVETQLGVSCLVFIGNEENVQAILQHPAQMVGSDGILVGARPHPRGWGSHVRFLAHYARDLGRLSWEEAIRKLTSAAARRLGCLDRGILRPGYAADITIFDPQRLRDTATYEQPIAQPEGVHYVLVNGTLVLDDGRHTGATPGIALREIYGRAPSRGAA